MCVTKELIKRTRKRMGKGGLSVKKQGGYQGLRKTCKRGLEPTERQKAIVRGGVGLHLIEIPGKGEEEQVNQ